SSMVNHKQGLVYGGIDTHADTHHVAVVDAHGRPLGDIQIPATTVGYRTAVRFLQSWPGLAVVGVECTGSYGAAVTREITTAGMTVREVNRALPVSECVAAFVELAGVDQGSQDVVGQVPETEGDATQVFEAAVDGFDGAVRQTGIEVGEDLVPPFPEAAAELGELAQAGGDVGVDALE